jgi:integrase
MAKHLTAVGVAKLRQGKTRREIPDGGCPGLYIIVQPSGHKSWALRFRRPGDRRPAKLVLGSVHAKTDRSLDPDPVIGGHLTLASARRLVAELKHQIAQGKDPAAAHLAEKRRTFATDAFGSAARDFIDQHARKQTRRWREQARLLGLRPTEEGFEAIDGGLCDRWRGRPLSEIGEDEVFRLIDEARSRGVPGLGRRAGPSEARARALHSALSSMFGWLMEKRRVKINPLAALKRPAAPRARDRVLNAVEVRKFWSAADAVGEPFGAVLKLLLLTGCRLNEVGGMRSSELSDDATVWSLPSARTKNRRSHIVPLPPLARDILAGVRRMPNERGFIFTTNGRTPVSGWSKIKKRADLAMGPVAPWRIHDLRRTAATGMAEIGIPPHIVEAALNHISGARASVAGTYNRAQYSTEKKAALERWADHVLGLISGTLPTAAPLHAGSAS